MRKTHLIPNPRYSRYESTHIRCNDGIYNIVFNWSPEHLANFDNFLNKHAMYTSSEQVVYEVCTTTPYIVDRYNELVDQVNAMRGDESKIDEYRALKKTLVKLSTFRKPPFIGFAEQKVEPKIHL